MPVPCSRCVDWDALTVPPAPALVGQAGTLCLKSSRKVYSECTSAGLCVTSFNTPYPSAAKHSDLPGIHPAAFHSCVSLHSSASFSVPPLCTSVGNSYYVCLLGCNPRCCCVLCYSKEQSLFEQNISAATF